MFRGNENLNPENVMSNKSNPNDRDVIADTKTRDANPDPITGAPGSHPVGTGVAPPRAVSPQASEPPPPSAR